MVNDSEELHTMTLSPGQKLFIGRLTDNDIVISHPAVSRKHLELSVTGSRTRSRCLCISAVPGATNPVLHRGTALETACMGGSFDLSVGPVNININARTGARPRNWVVAAAAAILILLPLIVFLSHAVGKQEERVHDAVTGGRTKAVECACTGTATCRRRGSRSIDLAHASFVRGRMDAAALVRARERAAEAECFFSKAGALRQKKQSARLLERIRNTIRIEKKKAAVSLDYFMAHKNTAAALRAALRLETLLGPGESERKRKIELMRARLKKVQGGI